jgi:hypothetical protein
LADLGIAQEKQLSGFEFGRHIGQLELNNLEG